MSSLPIADSVSIYLFIYLASPVFNFWITFVRMSSEKTQMMTCSFETVVTRSEMDSFRTNSRDFFLPIFFCPDGSAAFVRYNVTCSKMVPRTSPLAFCHSPKPKKGVLGTSLDWLETQTRKTRECRLRFLK